MQPYFWTYHMYMNYIQNVIRNEWKGIISNISHHLRYVLQKKEFQICQQVFEQVKNIKMHLEDKQELIAKDRLARVIW